MSKTFKKQGYYCFNDTGKPLHRWLAEKALGRRLTENEVVHHCNGIKTDNRLSNLVVMSKLSHDTHHVIYGLFGSNIIVTLFGTRLG